MSDKKIIIFALILSVLLIGGGWYYSKNKSASSLTAGLSKPPAGETPETKITETGIVFGQPDAPVTIEEYTNFLCPACGLFATETFGAIKENYIKNGKVKMVFYVYPPLELAQANLCSQEQNKFIEYHDYLFVHQREITNEDVLKNMAAGAGLDNAKFSECYESQKYKNKAEKWFEEGQKRGVDATPTFYINGEKLVGAQSFSAFQKIIDGKLK